jgi:hypothetical protein
MKVLLFTQSGDGAVAMLTWFRGRVAFGFARAMTNKRQRAILDAAAHWWLVECENAEYGRRLIAHASGPCYLHPSECYECSGEGRILDSGGMAVAR